MFQFVRANETDASAIAAFAERVFRTTFAVHHTAEDMNMYCSTAFAVEKQKAELNNSARETWLSVVDGNIVGYYQLIFGARETCVKDANPAELNRIYVDPNFHGKRLAHLLMEHAIQQAQARGHQTLWLGVWSRNDRALAFYKKWNFVEVGDHIFLVGTDAQRDLILERAL